MSTPCQWRRPHFPSKCTGTIAIIMTLRSCGYEGSSSNYLPLGGQAKLSRRVGNGADFRARGSDVVVVSPRSPRTSALSRRIGSALRVSQRTRVGGRSVDTLFRYWHTADALRRCSETV